MTDPLPPKVNELLRQELDAGGFTSRDDVLVAALLLLAKYRSHQQQQLREQIKAGVDQAEQGEMIELNGDNELRSFFEDVKRRGRERYERSHSA